MTGERGRLGSNSQPKAPSMSTGAGRSGIGHNGPGSGPRPTIPAPLPYRVEADIGCRPRASGWRTRKSRRCPTSSIGSWPLN